MCVFHQLRRNFDDCSPVSEGWGGGGRRTSKQALLLRALIAVMEEDSGDEKGHCSGEKEEHRDGQEREDGGGQEDSWELKALCGLDLGTEAKVV